MGCTTMPLSHDVTADIEWAICAVCGLIWGKGWVKGNFPNYEGPALDKLSVFSKYNYDLCFENFRGLQGYITEKIFDCFKSGTVPVYWGAENTQQWVSPECYVDARNYDSYVGLWKYTRSISYEAYRGYARAIIEFLRSTKALPFSIDTCCETLIDRISIAAEAQNRMAPPRKIFLRIPLLP
jgi:hypothetical protein